MHATPRCGQEGGQLPFPITKLTFRLINDLEQTLFFRSFMAQTARQPHARYPSLSALWSVAGHRMLRLSQSD